MTENRPAQWTTGCSSLDETRYKTESSNYYMSCMIACGHIWAKILGKEEPELQVHDPPLAPLLFLWVLQRSKGRLARLATRMAALAGDRPLSFCPKQNQHGVHGCHWCGMIVVHLHKRVDEEPSSWKWTGLLLLRKNHLYDLFSLVFIGGFAVTYLANISNLYNWSSILE